MEKGGRVWKVDEDVRGQIIDYLGSHSVCTLAIADGTRPEAHTMYYVSSGLHLFFDTNLTSSKVHVMQANPRVSVAVSEDYGDWRAIRGLQIFGMASVVDDKKYKDVFEAYKAKFPIIDELGGIPSSHAFFEIVPEKIYLLDFSKGFGHRSLYYVDNIKDQPFQHMSNMHWDG